MSFGDIDYPYFQMFFKDRCDEDKYYGEFSKKRIAIFTRDIVSGRDVKFQLMKMNNKKLMQMYNFNTLKFFYTEDKVNKELITYMEPAGEMPLMNPFPPDLYVFKYERPFAVGY